jgi:hypothetical protein
LLGVDPEIDLVFETVRPFTQDALLYENLPGSSLLLVTESSFPFQFLDRFPKPLLGFAGPILPVPKELAKQEGGFYVAQEPGEAGIIRDSAAQIRQGGCDLDGLFGLLSVDVATHLFGSPWKRPGPVEEK